MDTHGKLRIAIIGGSTGGASAAAQIRRFSEHAEIILFEKTAHVSTAYCGLAYGLGGVVADVDQLIPLQPEQLGRRFNVDVRTRQQIIAIDAQRKSLSVFDLQRGHHYTEHYDKLLLSTGAAVALPNIEGCELPGVFSLRTVDDLQQILAWKTAHKPRRAIVVGGGFIGLELVENLRHRGMAVSLVQDSAQLMSHVDTEMASLLSAELYAHNVEQHFNTRLIKIDKGPQGLRLFLDNQQQLETDMVLLATGTQPQTQLAECIGVGIGDQGGIVVDKRMATNIKDVYAIGDAVQLPSRIHGQATLVQLAAPLSQQARVAASNIVGRPLQYPGVLGTFVCKVFSLTVAAVGLTEKALKKQGMAYKKVILPATNHVFFYPGVESITLKVLFDPGDGRLLGAQAVGGEGTDKRIDALAVAIAAGMSIFDLEFLELAYAPPYGAPRDAVNLAGSVGAGLLRESISGIYPDELDQWQDKGALLVDVRSADEFELGGIPGAMNIPADELRGRINELPRDKAIIVCCQIGSKSTSSQRMLIQQGFECLNLLGGYAIWRLFHPEEMRVEITSEAYEEPDFTPGEGVLDVRGLRCPGPMVKVKKYIKTREADIPFTILVDDVGFLHDFRSWCERFNHTIHDIHKETNHYLLVCSRGEKIDRANLKDSV